MTPTPDLAAQCDARDYAWLLKACHGESSARAKRGEACLAFAIPQPQHEREERTERP